MVNSGLLACGSHFSSPFCIVKLIECSISLIMLCIVVYMMVQRCLKQRRANFFLTVSLCMTLTLGFIVVSSLNSDLLLFNFLYSYFYNVYFSIIVLKLGLKLLQKLKQSPIFKYYRWIAYFIFVIYQILIIGALTLSILDSTKSCLDLPFLVANAFSLGLAVLFALLGIKHFQWQQQKLDENLPQKYQNNPLPKFRIWILLNCIAQLMVLIQSVIFQVNACHFIKYKQSMKFSIFYSFLYAIIWEYWQQSYFFITLPQLLQNKSEIIHTLQHRIKEKFKQKWPTLITNKSDRKWCLSDLSIFFIILLKAPQLDQYSHGAGSQSFDKPIQQNFSDAESTPLGALEGNCLGKAAFSYVIGGAMGMVMAMFMNAVEMRQIQIGKVRRSTAIVLRKDWRKMKGTSKGFATFGGVFVFFECMIEHVRGKQDGLNSFLSGFGTSVVLGGNLMKRKQLVYSGLAGGFMCYGMYKIFKWMGH